MNASKVITNRMSKKSPGAPRTKGSKRLRKAHRKDDVKLLKQDLKYNLQHSAAHKKQAGLDKKLIRKKSHSS